MIKKIQSTITIILAMSFLLLAACSNNRETSDITCDKDQRVTDDLGNWQQDDKENSNVMEISEFGGNNYNVAEIGGGSIVNVNETNENVSLEEFIVDYIEKFHPPGSYGGIAISVFTRDEVILEIVHGYADTKAELPIESDTVFAWASITKLLTWISAMQLYERGELDLHADIFEYIPRECFPNIVYPITMFHLMHHTAGFDVVTGARAQICPMRRISGFDEPVPTLGDVIRAASALEGVNHQVSRPGERVIYSDYSTALAGYVIERASGMLFNEYVHANIFAPLGMYQTALRPDWSDNEWVQKQRDRVRGYNQWGLSIIQRHEALAYPAGAAFGTISDMAKFAMALLPDENGTSILFEHAETSSMLYPSLEDVLNASQCEIFGVVLFNGFMIFNRERFPKVIGHGGSFPGFRAMLKIDINTGFGIVASENTEYGLIRMRIDSFEEFFSHL